MTNIRDVYDCPYPYLLGNLVFGTFPDVEISQTDYDEIQHSVKSLRSSLSIEQKFDILLTNYLDFEKELANISLTSMLGQNHDYNDFFELNRSVSLRLANVLSAGRMYVDHLPHDVRSCVQNGNAAKSYVKALFSKEYDNEKYYRIACAIRNYSQHRSIPIHSVQPNGSWSVRDGKKEFCKHTVDIFAFKQRLESDPKFKRTTLVDFDEKIDLIKTIRKYISSIGAVHTSVRKYTENEISGSRNNILKWENIYRMAAPDLKIYGLAAIHSCDRKIAAETYLNLDWDDIRIRLTNRNRRFSNLSLNYISSASIGMYDE